MALLVAPVVPQFFAEMNDHNDIELTRAKSVRALLQSSLAARGLVVSISRRKEYRGECEDDGSVWVHNDSMGYNCPALIIEFNVGCTQHDGDPVLACLVGCFRGVWGSENQVKR